MDTEVLVQLPLPRGLLVLPCPLLLHSPPIQTYGPCTLLSFQRKPSNPTPSTMIPRETETGDIPSAAPPKPPCSASGAASSPPHAHPTPPPSPQELEFQADPSAYNTLALADFWSSFGPRFKCLLLWEAFQSPPERSCLLRPPQHCASPSF